MTVEHIMHPWRGFRPWRRHSLVLVVAGLVYIAIGFSYFTSDPNDARYSALYYARVAFEMPVWGAWFAITGCLAILSARWPPISKTWGYTMLTGLSTAWALFYLMGILFKGKPESGFSGFLIWGIVAFLWWAISGLVDPEDK